MKPTAVPGFTCSAAKQVRGRRATAEAFNNCLVRHGSDRIKRVCTVRLGSALPDADTKWSPRIRHALGVDVEDAIAGADDGAGVVQRLSLVTLPHPVPFNLELVTEACAGHVGAGPF